MNISSLIEFSDYPQSETSITQKLREMSYFMLNFKKNLQYLVLQSTGITLPGVVVKASVPAALATLQCDDLYTRAITRKSDDAKSYPLFFPFQFQARNLFRKRHSKSFHDALILYPNQVQKSISASLILLTLFLQKNGPSGNRTRVLGFEAQEDVLYPMDPSHLLYIKRY